MLSDKLLAFERARHSSHERFLQFFYPRALFSYVIEECVHEGRVPSRLLVLDFFLEEEEEKQREREREAVEINLFFMR